MLAQIEFGKSGRGAKCGKIFAPVFELLVKSTKKFLNE